MPKFRRSLSIGRDAFYAFLADDGWAIASHVALSGLMALFPFLLVLTALAAIFGSEHLADEAATLLIETWPEAVAGPIVLEIQSVLAGAHGGTLTIGALLAVYFSSSGIEGMRVALNRAYSMAEMRPWWLLRLESIGYVLVGATALLALAFLVVLAPLFWYTALRYAAWIEPFGWIVTFVRFAIASIVVVAALVIVHLWLPAGRRRFSEVLPGVVVTLVLWLAAGHAFGRYLADFAFTYAFYYAGLSTPMIALVFLYLIAAIFIYGGELNAVILRRRLEREPIR